jgi:hypothetical protein
VLPVCIGLRTETSFANSRLARGGGIGLSSELSADGIFWSFFLALLS